MQLYTARYQEFLPEWGVPVRSTLGNVRFPLPYTLAGHWKAVTPDREWFRSPEDEFRRRYVEKLESRGLERLMADAESFVTGDPTHAKLVVLCFDDVRKPGVWCHRTIMGEWFTEQGVPVIELCGHREKKAVTPPGQMAF